MPEASMGSSEFDDAYEDDPGHDEREENELGEGILEATIRDLDPRSAVTVRPGTTIRKAVELMLERKIGAVVVEQERRAVGVFTERDVMRRVVAAGTTLDRPVSEVMTPEPETLGLDDGIAFALNRMSVGGYRHVPIVDDEGRAAAVLSLRDVVNYIVSLLPTRVINIPPAPRLEARSEDGG
jgi:CBS domain-containing protein